MKSSCYPDGTGNHWSCLLLEFYILGKINIREEKRKKKKKNQLWDQTTCLSALKQFFVTAFQLFKNTNLQSPLGSVVEAKAVTISTCQPTPLVSVTTFRSGLFSGTHQLLQSTTQFSSSQLLLITWAMNYSCSRENILLV